MSIGKTAVALVALSIVALVSYALLSGTGEAVEQTSSEIMKAA